MDLSRWNIPHLSKIRNGIRNDLRDFRDFLGDVLDGERELLKDPKKPANKHDVFHTSDDWSALESDLDALKPGLAAEKILSAFAPYFEGALCLRNQGATTRLTGFVLFGQSFAPPDAKGSGIDLGLAKVEDGHVVRGRIQPILKSLKLDMLGRLHESEAFAFSPTEGVTYIFFCSRPHPWQVFAIENAYLAARDFCNRPSTVRARGLFK